jgi:DNA-directed RNA polymerase specialized sigma24 family protein
MNRSPNDRFEALYRAHSLDVLGYCARRTSHEEAKDAASDVFMVALRRIDDMPEGDRVLPWLYTVAKNVISNRNRSTRRRLRLASKVADAADLTVPGPEPRSSATQSTSGSSPPSKSCQPRTGRSSDSSCGRASAGKRLPRCSRFQSRH